MANAAARWPFCGSSIFFALTVFLLCFSSVVTGHSIVLQKRDALRYQLDVREVESLRITTVTTESTTITNVISVKTTTFGVSASVTPAPSVPTSSPQSSASASLAASSEASSSSIQATAKARLSSSIASSSPSSTPLLGSQRTAESTGSFLPSSALSASRKPSATPSSSVSPSHPSAPASVNSANSVPFTTFVIPPQGFASSPSPVVPPPLIETNTPLTSVLATSTAVVAAADRSSGFWHKKSAVAAVFVIVSLVATGALIVAFIVLRKRHRARKLREDHADLWEKFSDHSHRTRSNSPGPSINAAPLDAFAARDDSYIPTSREADFGNISSYSLTPVQHPDYYINYPPASSQQTPMIPSRAVPSTSLREPVGRASYQQSIDSFYGATGRAL